MTKYTSYLLLATFLFGSAITGRSQDGRLLSSWLDYQYASARREWFEKYWAKELREFRTVDPADLADYKNFLSGSKTGIFRLLPNFDCVTKQIVKVDGECTGYVPASSDFSFRSKTYADPQDHDIGYVRDEFISNAFFSQGILVLLGDVPLEKATLENNGIKFLANFQPEDLASAAHDHAQKFKKGLQSGGFTYASHLKAIDHATYALRFIGYRYGFTVLAKDSSLFETNLAELDYFVRRDIVVVFRVIRRDEHGNLIIVWKELSNKKAPKLKFAKGEKQYDFNKQ